MFKTGDIVVCIEPTADLVPNTHYEIQDWDSVGMVTLSYSEGWWDAARFRLVTPTKKPPKGPNEKQVGGAHYQGTSIQPWDFIIANQLGFLEGSVIKYVARYRRKGGLEDLRKAQHCLEKLIAEVEAQ